MHRRERERKTMAPTRQAFEALIHDLLMKAEISEEARFDGVLLTMKAHGLPCNPERVRQIRKYWLDCVAARKQIHKRR